MSGWAGEVLRKLESLIAVLRTWKYSAKRSVAQRTKGARASIDHIPLGLGSSGARRLI